MKFYKLYKLLKENWIKSVSFKLSIPIINDKILVDVFKNESLKNLPEDVRGIITKDGDLITINWVDPQKLRIKNLNINKFIIHEDLVHAYEGNNKFSMNNSDWPTYNNYAYIFVQRFNDSNKFYLSESYSDLILKEIIQQMTFNDILNKCKQKNPDKYFENINISYIN